MKKNKIKLLILLALLGTLNAFGAYKPRLDVSQGYVTTNNLTNASTYDSGVLSVEEYTQVQTHVNASHDGTMTFDFLSDLAGTDVVRTLTVPYVAANGFQLFSAPAFTPYVRYRFLNDSGSDQTDFFFETKFLTKSLSGQLLRTDGFISDSMISTLTRSVLVGQDSDGNYLNVPTDIEGNLRTHISDPLTAFGDLRVAELTPQVHLTFPYNINSDIVDTTVANGGTVTQTNSMAKLSTSTASNGSAIMSSRSAVNYRSGLGTVARFTGMFTTGVASSTQIIGIGDVDDGYFFGYNGTAFGLLVRKNSADTWTAQTAWNVDTLDGSGDANNPSGVLMDQTKLNVFQIKYQWLGAGEITFFIENPNTGEFSPVHKVQYANANTDPSVYNPSLTLYAQTINSGNTTDLSLQTASMAGFTEGKSIVTGPINTYSRTESISENSTNAFFVVSNKVTYVSKTNKVRVKPLRMSVANALNGVVNVKVYLNQTISNSPTYANVNGDNSVMEVATDHTPTAGTGKLVFVGSVGPTSGANFSFKDLDFGISPGDYLTVEAQIPDAAGNPGAAECSVSVTWREDF